MVALRNFSQFPQLEIGADKPSILLVGSKLNPGDKAMNEQKQSLNASQYAANADNIAQAAQRNSSNKASKAMNNSSLPQSDAGTGCRGGVCRVTWKPQRPAA
jgi:hypothetical protein